MKESFRKTAIALGTASLLTGCGEKWELSKFDNQDGNLYSVDMLSGKAKKIEDTDPAESRARHIIADALCALPGNPPPDEAEAHVLHSNKAQLPRTFKEAVPDAGKSLLVKDDNCVVFTAQTYGGWKTNAGSYTWGVYNRTKNQYTFFNTSGETLLGGVTKYSGPAALYTIGQIGSALATDPTDVSLRSGEAIQGTAVFQKNNQTANEKNVTIKKPK